jgi:N-acetylglutamate synthase-like GNAT family acetyltransferase
MSTKEEPLSLRQATPEDAKELHTFGLTIPEINVSSEVEFMFEHELRDTLASPAAVTFLALDKDGRIQGFCMGQTGDLDNCVNQSQACIVYIAVAKQWRRSTLATMLYRKVTGELKKRGVTYLYAWACPTSGAVDFFAKQGMAPGRSCVWMDVKL